MSLSPWDLTGHQVFDFHLRRPRRASYLLATQARQLNGSFKSRCSNNESSSQIAKKDRKPSYLTATQREDDLLSETMPPIVDLQLQNVPIFCLSTPSKSSCNISQLELSSEVVVPSKEVACKEQSISEWGRPSMYKNLIVLSLSFLLIFTSFRSIQYLQTSLNSIGRLGYISLACLHFAMFSTCLWAPVLVQRLTSKWAIVVAFFSYLIWLSANFWPHFLTLVPSSICLGFGQSLAWSAQVSYMRSLVEEPSESVEDLKKTHPQAKSASSETTSRQCKFNAFFLAVFQTSHIWGNILSSIFLTGVSTPLDSFSKRLNKFKVSSDLATCGIYDAVDTNLSSNLAIPMSIVTAPVLKLLIIYIGLAGTGFAMSLLFLARVKHSRSEAMDSLNVKKNIEMLINRRFFYLLPLLIFNGFEQAFITADYTKSYVTCSLGVEFVGYNMLTLGLTNLFFSFLIGVLLKWIPREALLGLACILHLSLMVVLLVWIPDNTLMPIYFLISAFWGVCNAIWQSQCNCLVSLCCKEEEQETAFQNVRLLQAFGASIAFLLGIFVGASIKLYVMITLLTTAVLSYVVLEYNVRRIDEPVVEAPSPREVTAGRNVFRQSDLS